ncbi:hypothetical protein PIROE2DRAFT_16535 [Piromyces sp. E2]|nr:hypothetical protein PIROE2DRAFT_16535 [Piromyces sp. E2]|eukprot:OUM58244.1 hypothetical protein PIROE2DRAFT_16535 [Piromyces sp. E2]
MISLKNFFIFFLIIFFIGYTKEKTINLEEESQFIKIKREDEIKNLTHPDILIDGKGTHGGYSYSDGVTIKFDNGVMIINITRKIGLNHEIIFDSINNSIGGHLVIKMKVSNINSNIRLNTYTADKKKHIIEDFKATTDYQPYTFNIPSFDNYYITSFNIQNNSEYDNTIYIKSIIYYPPNISLDYAFKSYTTNTDYPSKIDVCESGDCETISGSTTTGHAYLDNENKENVIICTVQDHCQSVKGSTVQNHAYINADDISMVIKCYEEEGCETFTGNKKLSKSFIDGSDKNRIITCSPQYPYYCTSSKLNYPDVILDGKGLHWDESNRGNITRSFENGVTIVDMKVTEGKKPSFGFYTNLDYNNGYLVVRMKTLKINSNSNIRIVSYSRDEQSHFISEFPPTNKYQKYVFNVPSTNHQDIYKFTIQGTTEQDNTLYIKSIIYYPPDVSLDYAFKSFTINKDDSSKIDVCEAGECNTISGSTTAGYAYIDGKDRNNVIVCSSQDKCTSRIGNTLENHAYINADDNSMVIACDKEEEEEEEGCETFTGKRDPPLYYIDGTDTNEIISCTTTTPYFCISSKLTSPYILHDEKGIRKSGGYAGDITYKFEEGISIYEIKGGTGSKNDIIFSSDDYYFYGGNLVIIMKVSNSDSNLEISSYTTDIKYHTIKNFTATTNYQKYVFDIPLFENYATNEFSIHDRSNQDNTLYIKSVIYYPRHVYLDYVFKTYSINKSDPSKIDICEAGICQTIDGSTDSGHAYLDSDNKKKVIICTPQEKCTSRIGSTLENHAYINADDLRMVITCNEEEEEEEECKTFYGKKSPQYYIDGSNTNKIIQCSSEYPYNCVSFLHYEEETKPTKPVIILDGKGIHWSSHYSLDITKKFENGITIYDSKKNNKKGKSKFGYITSNNYNGGNLVLVMKVLNSESNLSILLRAKNSDYHTIEKFNATTDYQQYIFEIPTSSDYFINEFYIEEETSHDDNTFYIKSIIYYPPNISLDYAFKSYTINTDYPSKIDVCEAGECETISGSTTAGHAYLDNENKENIIICTVQDHCQSVKGSTVQNHAYINADDISMVIKCDEEEGCETFTGNKKLSKSFIDGSDKNRIITCSSQYPYYCTSSKLNYPDVILDGKGLHWDESNKDNITRSFENGVTIVDMKVTEGEKPSFGLYTNLDYNDGYLVVRMKALKTNSNSNIRIVSYSRDEQSHFISEFPPTNKYQKYVFNVPSTDHRDIYKFTIQGTTEQDNTLYIKSIIYYPPNISLDYAFKSFTINKDDPSKIDVCEAGECNTISGSTTAGYAYIDGKDRNSVIVCSSQDKCTSKIGNTLENHAYINADDNSMVIACDKEEEEEGCETFTGKRNPPLFYRDGNDSDEVISCDPYCSSSKRFGPDIIMDDDVHHSDYYHSLDITRKTENGVTIYTSTKNVKETTSTIGFNLHRIFYGGYIDITMKVSNPDSNFTLLSYTTDRQYHTIKEFKAMSDYKRYTFNIPYFDDYAHQGFSIQENYSTQDNTIYIKNITYYSQSVPFDFKTFKINKNNSSEIIVCAIEDGGSTIVGSTDQGYAYIDGENKENIIVCSTTQKNCQSEKASTTQNHVYINADDISMVIACDEDTGCKTFMGNKPHSQQYIDGTNPDKIITCSLEYPYNCISNYSNIFTSITTITDSTSTMATSTITAVDIIATTTTAIDTIDSTSTTATTVDTINSTSKTTTAVDTIDSTSSSTTATAVDTIDSTSSSTTATAVNTINSSSTTIIQTTTTPTTPTIAKTTTTTTTDTPIITTETVFFINEDPTITTTTTTISSDDINSIIFPLEPEEETEITIFEDQNPENRFRNKN